MRTTTGELLRVLDSSDTMALIRATEDFPQGLSSEQIVDMMVDIDAYNATAPAQIGVRRSTWIRHHSDNSGCTRHFHLKLVVVGADPMLSSPEVTRLVNLLKPYCGLKEMRAAKRTIRNGQREPVQKKPRPLQRTAEQHK